MEAKKVEAVEDKMLTIWLSSGAHKKLKVAAAEEERTMQSLVEDLIHEYLQDNYDWEDEDEDED